MKKIQLFIIPYKKHNRQSNNKKQQLSQSISEYEQALKQQQDTYNQQNASVIEQNKQIEQANKVKQDEYEQKKQQYETDLANFENTKNEYEDWYRDQKQQLDIGIAKLVGDFDDTQAGSLRFYQNLTLTYDKDKLAERNSLIKNIKKDIKSGIKFGKLTTLELKQLDRLLYKAVK